MMRLRSLEISDFRKFDRPVRLEGLADGINVLAEPNEFGKSTLLAAIKAVLFERHRAKGQVGARMQHHRSATSPVLRLGFELAGGLHHIEKRFMHREPYARLTLPDGTRIEGDAAEERLQALLGFGPAGKQGATADSVGLWGALWVAQKEATHQPSLQETGRATLHDCLEVELGTMAGGDRSGALADQIRAELFTLLDGYGRPKGRFKDSGERLTETETMLAQLRDKRTALETTITELSRLRRETTRANDPAAEAQLVADLDDARKRREAALRHADVLKGVVSALELAERNHADLVTETRGRSARREAILAAERAQASWAEIEARLLRERVNAEASDIAARKAADSIEADVERAAQKLRTANEVSNLVLRSDQVTRLAGQLDRALREQAEVDRLKGSIAAHSATLERLQAVSAASTVLDRARAKLDALATEVEFDLEPSVGDKVRIAGSPVQPGRTVLRVVDDAEIDVAGIGRIRVRPAIRDRQTLVDAVHHAEVALKGTLIVVGAADPAEAAIKAAHRVDLERRVTVAEAVLKAATPGDPNNGLEAGLEALRSYVEAGRGRLAAEREALQLDALPTAAEAESALAAANATVSTTREAHAQARTALARPAAEHSQATARHGAAVLEAAKTAAELQRLRGDEIATTAVRDEVTLAHQLQEAATKLTAQRALVAQTQHDAPVDSVADTDARIKRLEEAIKQRRGAVHRLREEIVKLETRVAHDEAEGLDEQIKEHEARRDALAGEQEALRREAQVLTLLRDTLAEAEREARERYVAPVLRRMTPYLGSLFPRVELGLGDDLQITEVTRQGGPEAFDQLSDGTMEQIAVLLRLAYADLLLEQGKPAMLILDDALAYSDRDRLEIIFDILTRAAERMQILVLTCRADAFSRLGGNRLTLNGLQ